MAELSGGERTLSEAKLSAATANRKEAAALQTQVSLALAAM